MHRVFWSQGCHPSRRFFGHDSVVMCISMHSLLWTRSCSDLAAVLSVGDLSQVFYQVLCFVFCLVIYTSSQATVRVQSRSGSLAVWIRSGRIVSCRARSRRVGSMMIIKGTRVSSTNMSEKALAPGLLQQVLSWQVSQAGRSSKLAGWAGWQVTQAGRSNRLAGQAG